MSDQGQTWKPGKFLMALGFCGAMLLVFGAYSFYVVATNHFAALSKTEAIYAVSPQGPGSVYVPDLERTAPGWFAVTTDTDGVKRAWFLEDGAEPRSNVIATPIKLEGPTEQEIISLWRAKPEAIYGSYRISENQADVYLKFQGVIQKVRFNLNESGTWYFDNTTRLRDL